MLRLTGTTDGVIYYGSEVYVHPDEIASIARIDPNKFGAPYTMISLKNGVGYAVKETPQEIFQR